MKLGQDMLKLGGGAWSKSDKNILYTFMNFLKNR